MTWTVKTTGPAGPGAPTAPDLSLVAQDAHRDGARCSLWWRDTPQLDGEGIGAIGHYDASDDGAASAGD